MDNHAKPEMDRQELSSDPQKVYQEENDILAVAKGGSMALVGTVASRGLNYLYSFVLILAMGAENFGKFTLAMAIITFVGLVSGIGLPQGIIRYGAIHAHNQGKKGVHQIVLSAIRVIIPVTCAMMCIMFLTSGSIANYIFHKAELANTIRILAISIPFISIQSTFLAATRSLKVIRYTTIVAFVQPLTALLLAILLVQRGFGADGAALAYDLSFILGSSLAIYFYLRLVPRNDRIGEKIRIGPMLKFSIPLSMTEWMHFANERTEIFFLGLLPGTIDISIYKITWSLAGLETMLRLSLEQILAPFSSDLSHRQKTKELEALYKATTKWGFAVALMIFLIYVLFGKEILLIFDPSLQVGAGVLIALGFAQLFNEFTGPCNTLLIMSGRSGLTLINTTILFTTSIVLDWLLIPRFGLSGAAIAGATTVILVNILRVVEVWLTMKIHPYKISMVKPVLAGIVAAGITFLLHRVGITGSLVFDVLLILLFCVIYLSVNYLLKLDDEDLLILTTIRNKFRSRVRTASVVEPYVNCQEEASITKEEK